MFLRRVERKDYPAKDDEKIARALVEKIYEYCKELKTMVNKGLAAPIKIEILNPNSIERNSKTGKIKISIDNRFKT